MMRDINIDSTLQDELDAAHKNIDLPLSRDEVHDIIVAVMSSMDGDLSAMNLKLYTELNSLAGYINLAKEELASIRPEEISSTHIPSATDELDAIVGATEEATGQILDACEIVENISTDLPEETNACIVDAITRIYEACNFQDVTGQRITKVVKTLRHIEETVNQLIAAFGSEITPANLEDKEIQADSSPADAETPHEDNLLEGPQLPGEGIGQDEIDRLLASFD